MNSIRARLTLTLTLALALLLGAGGTLLYAKTKAGLEQREREALEAKAFAVGAAIEISNDKLEVELQPALATEFSSAARPSYYEVWNGDAHLLLRSPSFRAGNASLPVPKTLTRVVLPDGRSGIAIAVDASTDGEIAEDAHDQPELLREIRSGFRVVVAADALDLDATLGVLRATIVGVFTVTILAALFVVAFTLRRGLLPLERMAEQAQTIEASSLSTRFARDEMPRELEPIRDRLNDLLDRLEQAFQRESRFNSAVAHELRTPIAELRTTVEVAARWPDPADTPRIYADILAIAEHMQRLVSGLLALRRAESGTEALALQAVVVRDVIERSVARVAQSAAENGLAIDVDAPLDIVLDSEPDLMASIVDNWLSNAVEYAPRGSRVRVVAKREDGRFELVVANPAPTLGPDDLPFLFEPFWRKDAARSDREHAGLGLALSRAVAHALGFEASAEFGAGSELRIVLRGPLHASCASGVRARSVASSSMVASP